MDEGRLTQTQDRAVDMTTQDGENSLTSKMCQENPEQRFSLLGTLPVFPLFQTNVMMSCARNV